MEHTVSSKNRYGICENGNIQKEKRMEALLAGAIKSILGNIIALLLWAGYLSTGIDWFRTLGIISLLITIGYNGHKWAKEIHADFKSGKKKLPVRFRKK